jgi:hypothetical protein
LALCLTTLPIIINAKASLPVNTFPEGVSFDIAIDSGSTYCLSDRRSDFEGALTRVNVKIQGITEAKGISKWNGTACWTTQDDNGKTHVFTIPNMLLVESSLPCRILSPQHLSKEQKRNKIDTMKSGTRVIIGDEEVQLQWGDRQFIKTIKLSKANNIPIAICTRISSI